MEETKETQNKFEECDEDTLEFIASTLKINSNCLRKKPQIYNAKPELSESSKYYAMIKELRVKNRIDKADKSSEETLKQIYENKHGYITIDKPVNYFKRLQVKGDLIKDNKTFKKVCFEMLHENSPNELPEDLVNPFYCDTKIKPKLPKTNSKPSVIQILRRRENDMQLGKVLIEMCTISEPKKLHFKITIKEANYYLKQLIDQNSADGKIEFQYPNDLCSDDDDDNFDEEQEGGESVIVEMGSLSDGCVDNGKINTDKDLAKYLIENFESRDFFKTPPTFERDIFEEVESESLEDVGTAESRAMLLQSANRELNEIIVKKNTNTSTSLKTEKLEETRKSFNESSALQSTDTLQVSPNTSTSTVGKESYLSIKPMSSLLDSTNLNSYDQPSTSTETIANLLNQSDVSGEIFDPVTSDLRLGPKPILIQHTVDANGIEIKIYESSRPEDITENFETRERIVRFRTRVNLVLEYLYSERYVTDISLLFKHIVETETKQGSKYTLDRKSLYRIFMYLIKSNDIKITKIGVTSGSNTRFKYICHLRDLDVTPIIRSTIDQIKLNFTSDENEKVSLPPNRRIQYKMQRVTKSYGYLAKFSRLRVLHDYLFYVIYEYKAKANRNEVIEAKDVSNYLKEKYEVDIIPEFLKQFSAIYNKELNWKMFVPPLPEGTTGWALVCDLLAIMPLSIYVKIFAISFYIPELSSYLSHPIRKHVLIKNMPINIRNAFFYKRKYLFSMYDMLCYMCYLGLTQFGPQLLRNKDQFMVFLNRNATLYDTTSSEPGYHKVTKKEYPMLSYHFDTSKDIKNYWTKLNHIASQTKLGKKLPQVGSYVTIESVTIKPDLINACKPVTLEEASAKDIGYLPGDRAGAACIDSACWVHLRKNWNCMSATNTNAKKDVTVRKKHLDKVNSKPIKIKDLIKNRKNETNSTTKKVAAKKNKKVLSTFTKVIVKSKNKKRIVRQIVHFQPKKKPLTYDELDKSIKEFYGQTKAVWSKEEDITLLLCYNVFNYLCFYDHRKFLSATSLRDVMHVLLPDKDMKMSKTYQRRLLKLRKSKNKLQYSSSYIQLTDLYDFHKYFKNFRLKLKQKVFVEKHLNIAFLYAITMAYEYLKRNYKSEKFDKKRYDKILSVENVKKLESNEHEITKEKNFHNEPINEDEIRDALIRTFILITLNSKISNIQLFNIYQKFSDSALRSALAWLKNKQLIITIKSRTEKKGLQVTGKMFDLSFNYIQKQITLFPHNIFDEAYEYVYGINKNIMTMNQRNSEHSIETFKEIDARTSDTPSGSEESSHDEIIQQVTNSSEEVQNNNALSTEKQESQTIVDESPRRLSLEKFEQGHGIAMNEHYVLSELYFEFKSTDKTLIMNPSVKNYDDLVNELVQRYKRVMRNEKKQELYMDRLIPKDINGTDQDIKEYVENVINESLKENESPNVTGLTRKESKLTDLAFLLTKGLIPDMDDERKLEQLNNCFLIMYPTPTLHVTNVTTLPSDDITINYDDIIHDIYR